MTTQISLGTVLEKRAYPLVVRVAAVDLVHPGYYVAKVLRHAPGYRRLTQIEAQLAAGCELPTGTYTVVNKESWEARWKAVVEDDNVAL